MGTDFDRLWQRLILRVEREAAAFEAERQQAPERASEILTAAPRLRDRLIDSDPRFRSRALVQELLARSRSALKWQQPLAALAALRVALRIVERLGKEQSSGGLRELHAEVLCELGDTWRRLGPPIQAELWLQKAVVVLEESPDSGARALLCERLALLRLDERRDDEAVALLARAARLWASVGDDRKAKAARKLQALAQCRLGEVELSLSGRTRRGLCV